MAERDRALEDFLRMAAERQAWGGSTDREYFQRRQGLDLTDNRDASIENAPNMNNEVETQSGNVLQNLLGISQAHAATNNSQNDVDLPGTVLSRGIDRFKEWSAEDWKKQGLLGGFIDWATDGRGIDVSDTPDLSSMVKPYVADKISNVTDFAALYGNA